MLGQIFRFTVPRLAGQAAGYLARPAMKRTLLGVVVAALAAVYGAMWLSIHDARAERDKALQAVAVASARVSIEQGNVTRMRQALKDANDALEKANREAQARARNASRLAEQILRREQAAREALQSGRYGPQEMERWLESLGAWSKQAQF